MRLIIDANIFLNFYRQSPQSYKTIDALVDLLDNPNIKLVIPKQIRDEFERNKESTAYEFIKALENNTKQEIREPSFLSKDSKIAKIKDLIKKVSKIRTQIIIDYKERIDNTKSKINLSLEKIFSLGIEAPENNEITQRAYFRTLVGNPPRKGNHTFGDAIIWELILEYYTDDDLVIISGDGDFARENNDNEINLFLKKEWQKKTSKKITLYKTIGEFINSRAGKKKIKKEAIQEEQYYSTLPKFDYNINLSPLSSDRLVLGGPTSVNWVNTSTLMFPDQTCSCCGKLYENKNSPFSFMSRCENCPPLEIGHTCEKCGKHFHSNSISFNQKICKECGQQRVTSTNFSPENI